MTRRHRIGRTLSWSMAAAVLTACATAVMPPEIGIPRIALQDARDAGAERLVPRRFDEAAHQLAEARADADAAAWAAEVERQRLVEERRVSEMRAAELARLQLEQAQLRKQEEETQTRLSATLGELAEVRDEARGLIVSLSGSIYFDVDETEVRPEMHSRLVEIAKALAAVERGTLVIEGHTDSDGSAEYNEQLSELRAEAVRRILVEAGVGSDRVRAVGYGETLPRAPNTNPAAKAQNRRVEIVVEGVDQTDLQHQLEKSPAILNSPGAGVASRCRGRCTCSSCR